MYFKLHYINNIKIINFDDITQCKLTYLKKLSQVILNNNSKFVLYAHDIENDEIIIKDKYNLDYIIESKKSLNLDYVDIYIKPTDVELSMDFIANSINSSFEVISENSNNFNNFEIKNENNSNNFNNLEIKNENNFGINKENNLNNVVIKKENNLNDLLELNEVFDDLKEPLPFKTEISKSFENDMIYKNLKQELIQVIKEEVNSEVHQKLNSVNINSEISNKSTEKIEKDNILIHNGIFCNTCYKEIVGVRYKCLKCENINFCELCESSNKLESHTTHNLIKIKNTSNFDFDLLSKFYEKKSKIMKELKNIPKYNDIPLYTNDNKANINTIQVEPNRNDNLYKTPNKNAFIKKEKININVDLIIEQERFDIMQALVPDKDIRFYKNYLNFNKHLNNSKLYKKICYDFNIK